MILPPQKLTTAERLKRDATTGKNNLEETIDYYISTCNWNQHTEEILSLYRAVEGHLDQEEYKVVQNPQNKQKPNDAPLAFNAVLKDYNILKSVVNLLMGEFGRRNHDMVVTSINPSDEFAFKEGLDITIRQYYGQAVANSFSKMGFDLGQNVQELPPLEEYIQGFKNTFDETRIIGGQEILDYIRFNCDIDSKLLDLFWDWVITGGFCTFKTVNHDDVVYEQVPRHEIFFPVEKTSRYFEDRSYAVRRRIMNVYSVIDFFKGRIDNDMMDALESEVNTGMGLNFSTVSMAGRNGLMVLPTLYNSKNTFGSSVSSSGGVELFHVVYKTWKPYYVLYYFDELGLERKMEVGEDYTLNKAQGDIRREKHWENILYEGYKCLDFYLDCGELVENRADLNQEGLQKLPYNGIEERSSTGEIQSIVKDGFSYQRSVNVVHFQLEKLINKNKDKLIVMPYGLVPRKKGMDTKMQMYHADATSILWVDETAPNAALSAQMIKVLDVSLGPFITQSIDLIRYFKAAYWEAIGFNPQRMASIGQSAGKGVTEQAIEQSSNITYELVRQFDKCIEKDYNGLLDISKLAYIEGKKAKYVRSDGSKAFIDMNQDGAVYHSENSYNVFVRDASEMTDGIKAIRGQALNLIQNGGDASILPKLYQTNNIEKLNKAIEKLEANKREFEQMMQKQKDDANMALATKQAETAQIISDQAKYAVDMSYTQAIDVANIKADSNNSRDEPRPANEVEIMLANHKVTKDQQDLALKERQEQNKLKMSKDKQSTK